MPPEADSILPIKIILAEDNPADVYLLREALEASTGRTVELTVLTDGEQALQFFSATGEQAAEDLHLVVLDLNLPKSDGGEVLSCIRGSSAYAGVPVVVLTSSDSPRDRAAAEELGADGYLTKPSDLDQFMALGPRLLEYAAGGKSRTATN